MAESRPWPDREMLAACRLAGVCPVDGKPIEGGGYGTGRIADGIFCSLDCLASTGTRPVHRTEGRAHEDGYDS